MKRYCFKHTQLTNDLHENAYSTQKHLKLYSFMRTALTDSDFDDSEGSYIRNSEACMSYWHFRGIDSFSSNACYSVNDSLHDSFNSDACFSDNLPFTSD